MYRNVELPKQELESQLWMARCDVEEDVADNEEMRNAFSSAFLNCKHVVVNAENQQ